MDRILEIIDLVRLFPDKLVLAVLVPNRPYLRHNGPDRTLHRDNDPEPYLMTLVGIISEIKALARHEDNGRDWNIYES